MKSGRALRLFLPYGISMKNIPIYTWLLPDHSLNLHWKNCLHSGVGRVRSLFVYPFSFEEFLIANNETMLWGAIQKRIHKRLF